uniref:Phytanoyl-CoA dioxygenase n=1 Tax=Octactis speculum TaxID=3111310 RepID=A0A7S2DIS9_9STRA|mmetsp:Transcript_49440/g.67366  ORF Transcript_49440/g.67366 Transcript_49440/m.67366 type:complete len:548 (+) Transcript_49440:21-1664(+)
MCAFRSPHEPLPSLTDDQIQQFLVEGFLVLPPSEELPPAFHANVFRKADRLGKAAEGRGNNILPEIPELAEVFNTTSCREALTSLLGVGYSLHPHRFCHKSSPGRHAQTWHRDSFWGNWYPRNARPYWMMALYFPQDTPVQLGPTGVLPRSQYWNKDEGAKTNKRGFTVGRFKDSDLAADQVAGGAWHLKEVPLECTAGSVVLIHYDLWHRGPANVTTNQCRYMFKFQFSRLTSPADHPTQGMAASPSWARFLNDTTTLSEDDALAAALSISMQEKSQPHSSIKLNAKARRKAKRHALHSCTPSPQENAPFSSLAAGSSPGKQQNLREKEHIRFSESSLLPVWRDAWEWLRGSGSSSEENGCMAEITRAPALCSAKKKSQQLSRICTTALNSTYENEVTIQLLQQLHARGDEQEPNRVAASRLLGALKLRGEGAALVVEMLNLELGSGRPAAQAIEAIGAAALPPALSLISRPDKMRKGAAYVIHAIGRVLDCVPMVNLDQEPAVATALALLTEVCLQQTAHCAEARMASASALGCIRQEAAAGGVL